MTARLQRPEQLRDLLGVPFSGPQLDAATAGLEPGVIVAGAGSGKTTVMAARVVWLVGSGEVGADQVLGLTFTNKAAAELVTRVRDALGRAGLLSGDAGAGAGEPTISTYHAYAGRLVREHGLRIGVEPQSRLLADATRFQLATRALRAGRGPVQALSKPLWMLVDDLVALDSELSEHMVSTEALRAHDHALLAELAAGLAAGLEAEPKQLKPVRDLADAARKRLELSRFVDDYRALKRALDVFDFGDQVAFAAQLAEQRPAGGEIERDRFRVVLLDEYQDTSVAQRRLLAGLFPGGHPVTAVGDPCQAIYGWRGASVANLEDFPAHFPRADGSPTQRHSLAENRRSGGRLLALANTVATALRAVHRVEPLVPCAGAAGAGDTVCALLPTYAQEIDWAADQVRAAIDAGTPPAEVAVLVRVRSDFPALHAALVERDVPVEVVGLGGLLSLPEVADVVATLQVLDDPTSNAALVRLLTGPRWQIGARDLALLGRRARDLVSRTGPERAAGAGEPAGSGQSDGDPGPDAALQEAVAGVDPSEVVALADALASPGRAQPYSEQARTRFAAFAAELAELRRHLGEPLLDLLHRVITTSGLDVELAASAQAVAGRRAEALGSFLDRAASFADLDGAASVTAFLGFLRAAEQFERGLDTTAPSGGDTVKLLTAHKAKGLEWDVVVVPNLTAKVFPSAKTRDRWTTNGHVLPHPLRGDAESLPRVQTPTKPGLAAFDSALKEHSALEERRLAYVAFTRARHTLVASGHWWGPTQKGKRGPSQFLAEVREHCEAGEGTVATWAPEPRPEDTNPLLRRGTAHAWPRRLDPVALAAREAAAADVLAEITASGDQAGAGEDGTATSPTPLGAEEQLLVDGWDHDAQLLLEELRRARAPQRAVTLPSSLSTSQLQRLAADPQGLASDLARPMPRRPVSAARRGTRFHAWVEARFAQRPLLEPDDLPGAADAGFGPDEDLAGLQLAFEEGPYGDAVPYQVEAPFQLLLAGRVVRGRIDAVYRTPSGWEVVDWKTNRAQSADPLQLAVYRLAWAELVGADLADVSAAFVYVRTGDVVRPPALPGRAELEALLAQEVPG